VIARLAVQRKKHVLYQECFQRGLARDAFVIFCIEAQDNEVTLAPVAF
jgi:hypothetical protein